MKVQQKHVSGGPYKDLMTLVIDSVPNVFKPLSVRNTNLAFPFDGTQVGRSVVFLRRCSDESCIAQLGKPGKHTQTHHPETLGNAFTYGVTKLFFILLVVMIM